MVFSSDVSGPVSSKPNSAIAKQRTMPGACAPKGRRRTVIAVGGYHVFKGVSRDFVDDLRRNVSAAVALGFIGVHHTSYESTAAELSILFARPLG